MYADYLIKDIELDVNGDLHFPYVQVQNSYDRSKTFGAVTGLYRSKCSNGLLLGRRVSAFIKKRHVEGNEITDIVVDLDEWTKSLFSIVPDIAKLSGISADDEFLQEALDFIFERKSHVDKFNELGLWKRYREELGDNRYALLNAFTDFATHHVATPEKIRSYDQSLKIQNKIAQVFLG